MRTSMPSHGPRTRRPVRTLMALGGALVAAMTLQGCSAGSSMGGTRNPFGNDEPGEAQVRIRVVNFNFSDATVWTVIRSGRRQRLGTVTGKGEATFTVPWTFSEPLQLQFHLLAGPDCLTAELSVDPGDILELQIPLDANNDPMCR